MTTIDADPKGLAAIFRRVEGARAKRIHDAMHEGALLGAEIVAERVPRDVGTLASSIHAIRTEGGAEVVVDAPHAGVIEGGSRPHMPPLQPLIDWVIRHAGKFALNRKHLRTKVGIGPARSMREQRARDKVIKTQAEAISVARAIQHHIALKGSPPRWYMKNSLPAMRRGLASIVARAVQDP